MVVYGMESTLAVTVDMMINHGKAVMRGSSNACVIVDLPFGSYQESREQAFRTASRILAETGCAGVKLEGGAELADTVEFLSQRGIPVMAHIGLMPQQVNTMGGFKSQGHGEEAAAKVIADAKGRRQSRCIFSGCRRHGRGRCTAYHHGNRHSDDWHRCICCLRRAGAGD